MEVGQLQTPALLVERAALEWNLDSMATARPGLQLRPHVKAHKCSALAARQVALGHRALTCATIAEAEGLARAGLGEDLLVANEVLDATRLGALVRDGARVTLAVDSVETIDAAVRGHVGEVLIDVDVGLPRCGCQPEAAGALADLARAKGLRVRGVMGYEGHAAGVVSLEERTELVDRSMALLDQAHRDVGGDVVSAGSTGTYALSHVPTEIQAGSYALMDTAYDALGLPFQLALSIMATVISVAPRWAVADCGLKALGMDHGNPSIAGAKVLFCSDEHVTFVPEEPIRVGDTVRVMPAHVDPTIAYHEQLHLVDGPEVLETWAIDLRGW